MNKTIFKDKFAPIISCTWANEYSLLLYCTNGDFVVVTLYNDTGYCTKKALKFEIGLMNVVKCESRDKNQEEYRLLVGDKEGNLKVLKLLLYDQTFKLQQKYSSDHAHESSILAAKWQKQGFSFVSVGEDRSVKLWNKHCSLIRKLEDLRFNLSHVSIMNVDSVAFTKTQEICFHSYDSSEIRKIEWKAHDQAITALVCAESSIVSNGLDKRIRVWDTLGKQLWQSKIFFDKTKSVFLSKTAVFVLVNNDVYRVTSTQNTTVLTCNSESQILQANSNSIGCYTAVINDFGSLSIDLLYQESIEYNSNYIEMVEPTVLKVTNKAETETEAFELFDAKQDIFRVLTAFNKVVVLTSGSEVKSFCLESFESLTTVNVDNLSSPIVLGKDLFLAGKSVYTYGGVLKADVDAYPGENEKLSAINSSFLCWKTGFETSTLDVFDFDSKELMKLSVSFSVTNLSASQFSNVGACTTKDSTVYLFQICEEEKEIKLKRVRNLSAEAVCFSETSSLLCCFNKPNVVTVLTYPKMLFSSSVDFEAFVKIEVDVPKRMKILEFSKVTGSTINVLTESGISSKLKFSPMIEQVLTILETNAINKWQTVTNICRFGKMNSLWAILAYFALELEDYKVGEVAISELNLTPVTNFLATIRTKEETVQAAYLSIFKGDFKSAEEMLLSNDPPLLYDACKLNVKVGNFERAKEIAENNETLKELVGLYVKTWTKMKRTKDDSTNIEILKEKLGLVSNKNSDVNCNDENSDKVDSEDESKTDSDVEEKN